MCGVVRNLGLDYTITLLHSREEKRVGPEPAGIAFTLFTLSPFSQQSYIFGRVSAVLHHGVSCSYGTDSRDTTAA